MRWEFQLAFYALMQLDPRIILLWADVGAGLFVKHRADFPKRVVNIGICEQSTVSMAAGMAMEGLRPVVYTIMPFLIERAFEQIKIDVDQQNLPVGLVGHSNGESGPTHQELSGPVLMGLCKNIKSYFPETKEEIHGILLRAVNVDEPWFLGMHE